MFNRLDPNTVQSDAGFMVRAVRIHDVRYTEGGRSVTIPGEILVGDPSYVLYLSALKKWDPPFQADQLSETERLRIAENVTAALVFMGIKFVQQ
jgi:hypothetical protein